uniref:ETS-related transcription factor Elf-3 n=1 Tax=Apteryx owenii TaxID=8824 RepID=A0A8B9PU27_APTOW
MAGSCEISNIFSNYISAMYQPDEGQPTLDVLGHLGDDSTLGLSLPTRSSLEGWSYELPYFWTKVQVLEWISYHVEKNKYDASSIDFSCCNMDGHTLCHCTRDQMRLIFGPLGDELYDRLHEISEWPQCSLRLWAGQVWALYQEDEPRGPDENEKEKPWESIFRCKLLVVRALSFYLPGPVMSHSPNSQDSGGSDLDLDPAEAKLFPDDGFAGGKKGDTKHGKRKRGRPRKLSKESRDCLESRKSKHSPRGTHLWEFIRDILIHPELNEGLMKWEDRREGVFKFLRSEAVAQLWGQKKKNSSMTYEKLSRAMRYYYKREILERVDGRRLVYKFGKNSSGWKEEEVLNRNKEL